MNNLSLLVLAAITTVTTNQTASSMDTFPKTVQGYWAADQETCKFLKEYGVLLVPPGREWLKVSDSTIIGDSSIGKLRSDLVEIEVKPQMLDQSPAKFSAILQTTWIRKGDSRSEIEHLALSNNDQLYETIQGARASSVYVRCK
jgi:hypothetical protein